MLGKLINAHAQGHRHFENVPERRAEEVIEDEKQMLNKCKILTCDVSTRQRISTSM